MRITSLYIDDYKLLKKFKIEFRKDVSILIGINGSGKSTILEAIAQIFSDAFLKDKSKFGFNIEYELRLEEILEQSATTSEFRTDYIKVEISAGKRGDVLAFEVYSGKDILDKESDIAKRFGFFEKILPSNIVIYYSGLAEIMKRICLPHDEKLSLNYRKGNTNIQRPFFYFEPPLFNLILITLLSYEFGDIPEFLNTKAKIVGVQSIQIILKKPPWGKGQKEKWWESKGDVKTLLDLLKSKMDDILVFDSLITKDFYSKGNVVIELTPSEDYMVINIISQQKLFEIKEFYGEEKTFFKVLSTLFIDGLLFDVRFSLLMKDGKAEKSFSILSEGEQQTIAIRGLIELVNNENTLFLFDEPDTYLHPSWQRNFIENINQLSDQTEFNSSQFLITTHSPQLLSNADPESSDVQILEDGEVVKVTPKYFGRDISTILYELMGVERRNKKVTKLLSILFNLIEDEELEKAKIEYINLAELLGEDDPAIVRAKTQLDYLEEAQNEADK